MKNLRSYISAMIVFCLCFTFNLDAKNRKQKPRPAKARGSQEVNAAPSVVKDRRSSAPYITGDGFRSCCDHIFDEENIPFSPQSVKNGDKIFVKTDLLAQFFQIAHPKIQAKYVLITHNSDHPIPGPFAQYLDDEKILAWFGQNAEEVVHPKLHPIPIGLENRYNKNGNPDIVQQCMENFKNSEKKTLVYMNFAIQTSPTERTKVYRIFEAKPYCKAAPPKPYVQYLQDLAETKFTLSPRGNGHPHPHGRRAFEADRRARGGGVDLRDRAAGCLPAIRGDSGPRQVVERQACPCGWTRRWHRVDLERGSPLSHEAGVEARHRHRTWPTSAAASHPE